MSASAGTISPARTRSRSPGTTVSTSICRKTPSRLTSALSATDRRRISAVRHRVPFLHGVESDRERQNEDDDRAADRVAGQNGNDAGDQENEGKRFEQPAQHRAQQAVGPGRCVAVRAIPVEPLPGLAGTQAIRPAMQRGANCLRREIPETVLSDLQSIGHGTLPKYSCNPIERGADTAMVHSMAIRTAAAFEPTCQVLSRQVLCPQVLVPKFCVPQVYPHPGNGFDPHQCPALPAQYQLSDAQCAGFDEFSAASIKSAEICAAHVRRRFPRPSWVEPTSRKNVWMRCCRRSGRCGRRSKPSTQRRAMSNPARFELRSQPVLALARSLVVAPSILCRRCARIIEAVDGRIQP